MNENLVYIGAIVSGASIILGGLIIAALIMDFEHEYVNIILPVVAILVVAGIVTMLYGTSGADEKTID